MNYIYKAHQTNYKGVTFRSRLEARWAAFFDLIGWSWEYEPIDLNGWSPDFRVHWKCWHSECPNGHTLLVEVKPYYYINDFRGHPCTFYYWGCGVDKNGNYTNQVIPADSSAAFGINPHVTYWQMVHGAGGGEEEITRWISTDVDALWNQAGEKVQYKP